MPAGSSTRIRGWGEFRVHWRFPVLSCRKRIVFSCSPSSATTVLEPLHAPDGEAGTVELLR